MQRGTSVLLSHCVSVSHTAHNPTWGDLAAQHVVSKTSYPILRAVQIQINGGNLK